MTAASSVQAYVARQDKVVWRRKLIRALIRFIGFRLLANVEITGQENVPARGPCILMMNHISFLDPVICMGVVTSRYVIPMSKIETMRNPLVALLVKAWDAYTVKRGELDRTALMNSIELVKSGQMILVAPEGTRHPEGLGEGKDGMTYIAVKSNAVILPTALADAVNAVDHWKRLQRAHARVNFGRPFRFKTGGRARIPRDEMAQMTREAMYQLAIAQPDPNLRGVYSDLENATTECIEFVDPQEF